MKLLSYFKRYMSEHLVKAGANAAVQEGDALSRVPHLHTWFRTQCAVVMHLTNGTVQVSFLRKNRKFEDRKLEIWQKYYNFGKKFTFYENFHKFREFFVSKLSNQFNIFSFPSSTSPTTRRLSCARWCKPWRSLMSTRTSAHIHSQALPNTAAPTSSTRSFATHTRN